MKNINKKEDADKINCLFDHIHFYYLCILSCLKDISKEWLLLLVYKIKKILTWFFYNCAYNNH